MILTTVPDPLFDEHKSTSVDVTLLMLIGIVFCDTFTLASVKHCVTKLVTRIAYPPGPIRSVFTVENGLAVLFVRELEALNNGPPPSGSLVHTKL